MMKQDKTRPFGSKGPEGMPEDEKSQQLNGAKGQMKHVVTPGADGGNSMPQDAGENARKHLMMIALMRAAQQGSQPPMGGPQAGPMPGGPM